jgi:hypothetical protein
MSVEELIARLQEYPPKAVVKIYNGDSEEMECITGFLIAADGTTIELCSDDTN